jgi:hypothetical protein
MRKKISLFLFIVLFTSCHSDFHPDLSDIDKTTKFKRFDKAFFSTDTNKAEFIEQLNVLRKEYPYFFMSNETNQFFYLQRREALPKQLYKAVSKNLGSLDVQETQLNEAFKHYYYYYDSAKTYSVYSYISNLDFDYPVILADSIIFVATDLYLGVNSQYYGEIANYRAFFRQPAFMVRDVMEAMAIGKAQNGKKDRLLDNMIYHGKLMYFISRMMPDQPASVITKFTDKDIAFARENEKNMWSYFIENNLLFDTGMEAKRRFIELAPFSKFYTKLDNDSPGMIGRWVGYRVVKSYMENTETTLKQLMNETDADKILRQSNYKP